MTPKDCNELRLACDLVEGYLRTLGKEVQLVITPKFVELADTSWAGSSVEANLYSAVKSALESFDIQDL